MPAALDVDWAAVRTLAVAIGLKDAAEKLGLPYGAVRQRSAREGWLDGIPRDQQLPATVRKPVTLVTSPADAMRSALAERGAKSRLALARGLGKAADHVENMEGKDVLAEAQNIKALTGSLATVHAWDAQSGQVRVDLRVTSDRTADAPAAIEAEWTEDQGFTE